MVELISVVCVSDTHCKHKDVILPPGDILVHAGDFTATGTPMQINTFGIWLQRQKYEHKIVIAGNHDLLFESDPTLALNILKSACPEVIYLQDSGCEVGNLRVWGSPWTPTFHNWAFNASEEELSRHWSLIPESTDLLITHGPPAGICDVTMSGYLAGSESLRKEVDQRIEPMIHVFGHIHESYGQYRNSRTKYYNVAQCNLEHELVNKPVVLEISISR